MKRQTLDYQRDNQAFVVSNKTYQQFHFTNGPKLVAS
jgi:hypothetical protein